MRTQPLSYKWACPNFNSKQNLDSSDFFSLRLGWGRHRGGVLVTTMSDNQFRTLVLLERSLFGLRPQRLLSNNTVFLTDYLIHNLHNTCTLLCCNVSQWANYNTVSTAAFHARVRGSVPGLGGLKETKMFLPHPRVKVSIVGSLRDREVACSASDRQGSNFESCVWRAVSSQSSHHPQEVLLAQFSLYVHKGGLKPDSFHFIIRLIWVKLHTCDQASAHNVYSKTCHNRPGLVMSRVCHVYRFSTRTVQAVNENWMIRWCTDDCVKYMVIGHEGYWVIIYWFDNLWSWLSWLCNHSLHKYHILCLHV